MIKQNKNITFDSMQFINSLIREMGMENEKPEIKKQLEESIGKQMTHIILNTTSLNLESEVIDDVLAEYKDETDPTFFISRLIKYSPHAQVAILEELDNFYIRTLETFHKIKQ